MSPMDTVYSVLRKPDKFPEQFTSWLRRFVMDNALIAVSKAQDILAVKMNTVNTGDTFEVDTSDGGVIALTGNEAEIIAANAVVITTDDSWLKILLGGNIDIQSAGTGTAGIVNIAAHGTDGDGYSMYIAPATDMLVDGNFQVQGSGSGGMRVNGNTAVVQGGDGVYLGVAGNKIGAFGATPIVKPTGVPVTAAGIHAALVSLGWIAA